MNYDQESLTSILGNEAISVAKEIVVNFATLNGTAELVQEMIKGKTPDTRLFLRPIYRLCKHMITDVTHPTVPRTSQCWIPFQSQVIRDEPSKEAKAAGLRWRNHTNFAVSFAVAEWIVQLSTIGDEKLGIPPQLHLQPAYAFNTIITMAQRASAALEARAAYARMCYHNLSPDVFTMTALIDVFGRAHEVNGAFWLFQQMPKHTLDPNVVTLVTSARVSIVHRDDVFFMAVLNELSRLNQQTVAECCDMDRNPDSIARMSAIVVMSSFECCIGAERFDLAEIILQRAKVLNVSPTREGLIGVLVELYHEEFDNRMKETLIEAMTQWEEQALIPLTTVQGMLSKTGPTASLSSLRRIEIKMKHTLGDLSNNDGTDLPEDIVIKSPHSHRESLGKNSPRALRQEVVEHDMSRLEHRLETRGHVSKEDFETLIHQCRKRKWSSEVHLILEGMHRLATKYAFLEPDAHTVCVVVDAFVDSGDPREALKILQSVPLIDRDTCDDQRALCSPAASLSSSPSSSSSLLSASSSTSLTLGDVGVDNIAQWCKGGDAYSLGEGYMSVCLGGARFGDTQLIYHAAAFWLTSLTDRTQGLGGGHEEIEKEERIFNVTQLMMLGAMRSLGSEPQLAVHLLFLFNKMTHKATPRFQMIVSWSHFVSLLIESSSILSDTDREMSYLMRLFIDSQSITLTDIGEKTNEHQPNSDEVLNDFRTFISSTLRNHMNSYHGAHVSLSVSVLMSSATIAAAQNKAGENCLTSALQHLHDRVLANQNHQLTLLAHLPLFPCILLEGFGRCPNAVIKKNISTRAKRRCGNGESVADSLPFKSFIRPNLLSCVHKRTVWLRRIFRLMRQTYTSSLLKQDKEADDGVQLSEVVQEDDEIDNDDQISAECITYWEHYFQPVMSEIWDSHFLSQAKDEDGSDGNPFVPCECNDVYLKFVSTGQLASNELGALLRLQRIYVRTLNTRNKFDKINLQNDIMSLFRAGDDSQLVSMSLIHLASPYLMLPDKMQGKLAKLICETLKESKHIPMFEIVAELHGTSIEVLREVLKSLILKKGDHTPEEMRLYEKLKETALGLITGVKRDKLMKVALFLKELRRESVVAPSSEENERIFNILLGFSSLQRVDAPHPTDDSLDAAVSFAQDGLEKELVVFLKDRNLIHLASQLACRFSLTADPVFLQLVRQSDQTNFASLNSVQSIMNNIQTLNETEESYLRLDMLKCSPIVVSDLASLQQASEILRSGKIESVGLDAEWQPFNQGGEKGTNNPVAVLQVATQNEAFLFDLLVLEGICSTKEIVNVLEGEVNREKRLRCSNEQDNLTKDYHDLIIWLLSEKSIKKYGFGVKEDIRRLKTSYSSKPFQHVEVNMLIDFRDDVRFKKGSLSNAVKLVLGKTLDKTMQTSDWGKRPLTETQIHYAALDARCLLELVN